MSEIKRAVASFLVLISLTGCSNSLGNEAAPRHIVRPPREVIVKKGAITPTISDRSAIMQSPVFALSSPKRGSFKPVVKAGDTIKAGMAVGLVNGQKINAPVDARVVSVASQADDLPANYALIQLEYQGFGIVASQNGSLSQGFATDLRGKFQVVDGLGPTDCKTIVQIGDTSGSNNMSESNAQGQKSGEAEAGSVAEPNQLVCLIDKKDEVKSGQQTNLVISGVVHKNALALPIEAVSGRIDKGKVYKSDGTGVHEVDVKLGVTDGANIEILEGLSEGDKIIVPAPDVDPRKK